jgi:hypothetical protein
LSDFVGIVEAQISSWRLGDEIQDYVELFDGPKLKKSVFKKAVVRNSNASLPGSGHGPGLDSNKK